MNAQSIPLSDSNDIASVVNNAVAASDVLIFLRITQQHPIRRLFRISVSLQAFLSSPARKASAPAAV